jgi:hypothetical protein
VRSWQRPPFNALSALIVEFTNVDASGVKLSAMGKRK